MASTRTFLVPLALGVLTLAACGGSDDGSASPGTGDGDGSETVESVTPADDQGDAGNEAVADADADTGVDNDSGDDVDSIDDIVDLDELEDQLSNFSTGEGGGTITIDGVAYTFEAEVCIAGPVAFGSFIAEGAGTTPDGEPFYGDISLDRTERADMEDFVDEAVLETMFPDGAEVLEDVSISVAVGQGGMFEDAPADQPNWDASTVLGEGMFGVSVDYQLDGTTFSGSGQISDLNGVAAPFGDTVPFEFTASCG